jgi:hypothetical protein
MFTLSTPCRSIYHRDVWQHRSGALFTHTTINFMSITDIAEIVHEIQRVFCASIGETLPTWEEAGLNMRSTTMLGVHDLIHNPNATGGFSHEQWMKHKVAEGYVYGEVRDHVKKTHPSLIPFAELPHNEQTKDHLFVQTVRSLEKFL